MRAVHLGYGEAVHTCLIMLIDMTFHVEVSSTQCLLLMAMNNL